MYRDVWGCQDYTPRIARTFCPRFLSPSPCYAPGKGWKLQDCLWSGWQQAISRATMDPKQIPPKSNPDTPPYPKPAPWTRTRTRATCAHAGAQAGHAAHPGGLLALQRAFFFLPRLELRFSCSAGLSSLRDKALGFGSLQFSSYLGLRLGLGFSLVSVWLQGFGCDGFMGMSGPCQLPSVCANELS